MDNGEQCVMIDSLVLMLMLHVDNLVIQATLVIITYQLGRFNVPNYMYIINYANIQQDQIDVECKALMCIN